MAAQSIAVTSGGLEAIPGNMAGYILVGMGYGLDFLMSVVRKHRTFKYYVEGKSHLISETFEHEAMESVWRDSLAFNIISKVKSITSAPVVFAPCPYLTSEVLTDKAFSGYWDNEAMREEVYARYQKSLSKLNIPVVQQPFETTEQKMFTQSKFRIGAIRFSETFSEPLKERDFRHMNAEFGALYLRELLERL